MSVPPQHSATVRTEFFLTALFVLQYRLTTVFTKLGVWDFRVSVNVSTDGSGRQSKYGGNHGRAMPLKPHIVNGDFVL